MKTTVIGSFPKPSFLKCPDWFCDTRNCSVTEYKQYLNTVSNKELEDTFIKATKHVLNKCSCIDIVTDGEIRRENYVHYFCRNLHGISFSHLTEKEMRNGAYKDFVPTIYDKIMSFKNVLSKEWLKTQSYTNKPVKITLPGPMTIFDTLYNNYYETTYDALNDLSKCLNTEIRNLAKIGCKYIQIDEPILARKPELLDKYGTQFLHKCFFNTGKNITKIIHICCGYPDKVGDTDYIKADCENYNKIILTLDQCDCIDQISIEDAHRYNNEELFKNIKNKTIILGVVKIADINIESVEEIKTRINTVLQYIPPSRLVIAPDCGLGMLPEDICEKKLNNMACAVKDLNKELNEN